MSWAVFAVLSAGLYGVWGYCLRVGTAGGSWKPVLFWATLIEFLVVCAIGATPSLGGLKWGGIAGICAGCGYALLALALARSGTSLVVPLGSLYPVVTVILAVIFLHDSISVSKVLDVAMAVGAVWLLAR